MNLADYTMLGSWVLFAATGLPGFLLVAIVVGGIVWVSGDLRDERDD